MITHLARLAGYSEKHQVDIRAQVINISDAELNTRLLAAAQTLLDPPND